MVVFYEQHDATKVDEVDAILSKCVGKEAILFSVLAEKHGVMNGLDPIFKARLDDSDYIDYLSLLQLYLSIFHPASTSAAESMLYRYGRERREAELFAKLAEKFRSTNPLRICNVVKKIDKSVSENVSLHDRVLGRPLPQNPAMIATR